MPDLSPSERRQRAVITLMAITEKLAAGAEFKKFGASDMVKSMRASLETYGVNARVSPAQLKFLEDINRKWLKAVKK